MQSDFKQEKIFPWVVRRVALLKTYWSCTRNHLHRPEIGLNSDLIWRGIRNGKVSNLHLFMLPGLMTIPMDVSASIMTAKYQLINDGGACGGSLPARSQIGDP